MPHAGALRDPVTGYLSFGRHPYDPERGMWLHPRYDRVVRAADDPNVVYLHRFHDNDPVNDVKKNQHYTSEFGRTLNKWNFNICIAYAYAN